MSDGTIYLSSSDEEEENVLPNLESDDLTPNERLYVRSLVSLFVLFYDVDDGDRRRWVETLRDLLHEAQPLIHLEDDRTKTNRIVRQAGFGAEGAHSHIGYTRELLGSTVGLTQGVNFLERLRDGLVRDGRVGRKNEEMKKYAGDLLARASVSSGTVRRGVRQSVMTEVDHKPRVPNEEDSGIFVTGPKGRSSRRP